MKKIIFSLCALCVSMGLMANSLPEQVVLVGDATEAGWCIENGVFMHTESEGVYTWTGTLQRGELKFVAAGEFWVPSYGPVTNGDSLHWADTTQVYSVVARPTFDDADNKFIADSGRYQLTLNLNTMQLTVADGTDMEDTKAYVNRVYPIGTACTWGWKTESAQPMPQTGEETGIYSDTLALNAGELKFLLQPSFDIASHFGPDTANTPLDTVGVHHVVFHADGDYKWNCTLSGTYVVTLNSIDSTLTLALLDTVVEEPEVVYPEVVYPIGTACTWGWTTESAQPMPQTGEETGIYTDTLALKAGELKFLLQPSFDIASHFGPDTANTPLDTVGVHHVVFHADGDYKWNCTLSGTYVVTLNSINSTLTVALLDTVVEEPEVVYPEVVYPIGTACTWGWTIENAETIAQTGENTGIYTDTLSLQAGELKFLCQADFGKHFGPKEPGVAMAEAGEYEVVLIEDGDNKWNNTLVGDFVVTLNAESGTLTLVAVETPENPDEAIRNTTEQEECKKVLRNGQVIILRGDKAYNLLGVTLR